jgi:hypothetical protein
MKRFRNWPGDFLAPRVSDTEFGLALISLFDEMIAKGGKAYADDDWALFGFSQNYRMIDFVRRGSHFWEVWPQERGEMKRLGPFFGLAEHACIVVRGIEDIRTLATRWLDGAATEIVTENVTFWDRCDIRQPLERIP